jgi:hypothetical protein
MDFAKTMFVLMLLATLISSNVSAQEITRETVAIEFMVDYWGTLDADDYTTGCSSFLEELVDDLVFG